MVRELVRREKPDYSKVDWHLPLNDVMRHIGAPPNDFNKVLTTPFGDKWWHETMHYYDGSECIDVPAMHVSTWYDISVLESIDSFNFFRSHGAVTAYKRRIIARCTSNTQSNSIWWLA